MLKHYGLYLDLEFDADLIAFLEPFAKKRRVGQILRDAVRMYKAGGVATFSSPPPILARASDSIRQSAPTPQVTAGNTDSAKSNFRKSLGR